MDAIKLNTLLNELNRTAAVAGNRVENDPAIAGGSDFASMFKGMLNTVNQAQQNAAAMSRAFELGEDKADLAEVMINLQKSRLHFQTTLQVRNKLISAYQDIMNMPL